MKALEASTTRLVNDLIDQFIGREEIDFCAQFSTPFPSQVFLAMFWPPDGGAAAVPRDEGRRIRPDQVVGRDLGHPETEAYQQKTADSIYAYFEQVIAERADVQQDDLLNEFLHGEVDGERLTVEEILDICFLFLIAGLDTVTATLDCFFAYLADHPDARSSDRRNARRGSGDGRRDAPLGNSRDGLCLLSRPATPWSATSR